MASPPETSSVDDQAAAEQLCERCKSFNLQAFFQGHIQIDKKDGIVFATLSSEALWSSTDCPICQLLCSLQRAQTGVAGPTDEKYCIYGCGDKHGFDVGYCLGAQPFNWPPCLSLVPEQKLPLANTGGCNSMVLCKDYGFIWNGRCTDERSELVIYSKHIGPKVDLRPARKWLDVCKKTHGSHSRYLPPDYSRRRLPITLIDCETKTHVPADTATSYFALSYVWGQDPAYHGHDSSTSLSEAPNLIQDAIEVTRQLQARYLWIDKYCIDQKNKVKRQDQIMSMDFIYQCAELTIVANSASYVKSGLPGIRDRVVPFQERVSFAGQSLGITPPVDSSYMLRDSQWMTRGWTYQESLFAERRLIFTDHRMFFECDSMRCIEDLETSPGELQNKDACGYENHSSTFPLLGDDMDRLWVHIGMFSERNLTRECDVLDGMQGIFQAYQRLPTPIYHLWGIPIMSPSHGNSSRSCVCHDLYFGLLWVPVSASRRRVGFPSWSWTGWLSDIVERGSGLPRGPMPRHIGFQVSSKGNTDIEVLYVCEAIDRVKDYGDIKPQLVLEIQVTKMRFQRCSKQEFISPCRAGERGHYRVWLDVQIAETDELFQQLQTETWDVIGLFSPNMLIRWKGDIAERIGRISGPSWVELSRVTTWTVPEPTEPEWRTITLG